VAAKDLALVPDKLDLVKAAALPVVTLTGNQLIAWGTKIQAGQTVLVAGAVGSVGRSAVWTAKKAGAKVIAGVRRSQVKEAATLRADQVLALDDAAAIDKLGFIDAVADTVDGETAQKLLGKVKQGGIFATVLGPPANAGMHPTVKIEHIQSKPDAAMLRIMAEDVAEGRFVFRWLTRPRPTQLPKKAESEKYCYWRNFGIALHLSSRIDGRLWKRFERESGLTHRWSGVFSYR
jgi:NADPH:quinone reductase-like Zn-dependent oxidoreductase